MYECERCNYLTSDISNFHRHQKTKKHLQKSTTDGENKKRPLKHTHKVQQKRCNLVVPCEEKTTGFICEYCQKPFTRNNTLANHQKKCKLRLDEINDLKMKIESQKHEYEEKLKDITFELKLAQQKIELIEKSDDFNKAVITNTLTYLNKNHNSAPALKAFDNWDALENYKDPELNIDQNDELAVNLAFIYHHGGVYGIISSLVRFLCEEYLTNDPAKQSIWTTDLSRKTYFLREELKKGLVWVMDKGGESFKKIIVGPLHIRLKEYMTEYRTNLIERLNSTGEEIDDLNLDKGLLTLEYLDQVCEYIDGPNFPEDFVRIAAKKFQFNHEKLAIADKS